MKPRLLPTVLAIVLKEGETNRTPGPIHHHLAGSKELLVDVAHKLLEFKGL